MAIKVSKVDVWVGEMEDRPGALDRIMGVLSQAGVNLEAVIARRTSEKPGWGHVYLTPVSGKKAEGAALAVGLMPANKVSTLRIEAPNKPGVGHAVMGAISAAGINVRGVSFVTVGSAGVGFIGFHSSDDAERALAAIKKIKVNAGAKKSGKAKKARGKKR